MASPYAELGKNVCDYDAALWNFSSFCAATPQNVLAQVRIAWWLRRWKFAFTRTLIVLGSLAASVSGVIVIMAT